MSGTELFVAEVLDAIRGGKWLTLRFKMAIRKDVLQDLVRMFMDHHQVKEMSVADQNKIKDALQEGRWKTGSDEDRTIMILPGNGFDLEYFMKNVEPGLAYIESAR